MPFAMKTKDGTRPGSPGTVFASFLHFDMCFTMWVILGALGVLIAGKQGLKLSIADKGWMVAIPTLSGSIARVPVGILGDRFGSKRVGIIMLVFLFIPLTLGWLLNVNFPGILGIGVMIGVAGASFAIALPLASRWYPPAQQGLVMGIAAAGNIGTVIAIIFAPVLAKAFTPAKYLPHYPAIVPHTAKNLISPFIPAPYGWHAVLGFTMIPLALVLITFILLSKESPTRPQGIPVTAYLGALKKADIWWFCLLYSITFGGFVGLGSFLSVFYNDQYTLPVLDSNGFVTLATASGLAALAAFMGSSLRPVGGFIADKVGGTRALTVLLVVIAIVYATAGFLNLFSLPLPYMATIMVIGVACLGMGNGAVFQVVPQRFRTELGVATGLVGAFGGLGGFYLPILLTSMKQGTGNYAIGWLILAVFVVFALVVLRILMATRAGWGTAWAPTPEVQLEVVEEGLEAAKVGKAELEVTETAERVSTEVILEATEVASKAELEQTVATLEAGETEESVPTEVIPEAKEVASKAELEQTVATLEAEEVAESAPTEIVLEAKEVASGNAALDPAVG